MRKLILLMGIVALFAITSCETPGNSIDSALVGRWVATDTLGGAWHDYDGGTYGGMRFFSNKNIYVIESDDGGVTWQEVDTGIDLKKADDGSWESSAGGHGTYTISGSNLTWVNDATAITAYFTKL